MSKLEIKKCLKISIAAVVLMGLLGFVLSEVSNGMLGFSSNNNVSTKEEKQAGIFIIETRKELNDIQKEFTRGKKQTVIAKEANMDSDAVLEETIANLETIRKEKVSYKFHEDANEKASSNVNLLLDNTVKELEHGLQARSEDEYRKHVSMANKQIELANKQFLQISKENGYEDIRPLDPISGDY